MNTFSLSDNENFVEMTHTHTLQSTIDKDLSSCEITHTIDLVSDLGKYAWWPISKITSTVSSEIRYELFIRSNDDKPACIGKFTKCAPERYTFSEDDNTKQSSLSSHHQILKMYHLSPEDMTLDLFKRIGQPTSVDGKLKCGMERYFFIRKFESFVLKSSEPFDIKVYLHNARRGDDFSEHYASVTRTPLEDFAFYL